MTQEKLEALIAEHLIRDWSMPLAEATESAKADAAELSRLARSVLAGDVLGKRGDEVVLRNGKAARRATIS